MTTDTFTELFHSGVLHRIIPLLDCHTIRNLLHISSLLRKNSLVILDNHVDNTNIRKDYIKTIPHTHIFFHNIYDIPRLSQRQYLADTQRYARSIKLHECFSEYSATNVDAFIHEVIPRMDPLSFAHVRLAENDHQAFFLALCHPHVFVDDFASQRLFYGGQYKEVTRLDFTTGIPPPLAESIVSLSVSITRDFYDLNLSKVRWLHVHFCKDPHDERRIFKFGKVLSCGTIRIHYSGMMPQLVYGRYFNSLYRLEIVNLNGQPGAKDGFTIDHTRREEYGEMDPKFFTKCQAVTLCGVPPWIMENAIWGPMHTFKLINTVQYPHYSGLKHIGYEFCAEYIAIVNSVPGFVLPDCTFKRRVIYKRRLHRHADIGRCCLKLSVVTTAPMEMNGLLERFMPNGLWELEVMYDLPEHLVGNPAATPVIDERLVSEMFALVPSRLVIHGVYLGEDNCALYDVPAKTPHRYWSGSSLVVLGLVPTSQKGGELKIESLRNVKLGVLIVEVVELPLSHELKLRGVRRHDSLAVALPPAYLEANNPSNPKITGSFDKIRIV